MIKLYAKVVLGLIMAYNKQILDKYILFFSLFLVKSLTYYFNVMLLYLYKRLKCIVIIYYYYLLFVFIFILLVWVKHINILFFSFLVISLTYYFLNVIHIFIQKSDKYTNYY